MISKPRRPDMRLFDREILLRGLLQGGGLLLMLVCTYLQVRWSSQSDDLARTVTYVTLVLANLGLIYTNRTWSQASWPRREAASRSFAWISVGTILLLLLVLSWGTLRSLFAFELPGPWQLAGCGLVVALSVAWFELVKWAQSRISATSLNHAKAICGGTR